MCALRITPALLLAMSSCVAVPLSGHGTPTPIRQDESAAEPAGPSRGAGHDKGDVQVLARAHYEVPVLGKSLFWDGNGETDSYGLGLSAYWFLADDFALGAGLNGTVYNPPGGDIYGSEFEAIARYYWLESESFDAFLDANTGYMQSTSGAPPGGTEWNFSFGFGPGMDIPLGESTSLQIAATYHHISNALGRDHDRNPSQNAIRVWAGVAVGF